MIEKLGHCSRPTVWTCKCTQVTRCFSPTDTRIYQVAQHLQRFLPVPFCLSCTHLPNPPGGVTHRFPRPWIWVFVAPKPGCRIQEQKEEFWEQDSNRLTVSGVSAFKFNKHCLLLRKPALQNSGGRVSSSWLTAGRWLGEANHYSVHTILFLPCALSVCILLWLRGNIYLLTALWQWSCNMLPFKCLK